MLNKFVKRGDIYYADLGIPIGSEQGGVRPVLVVQNDTGNRYSPTIICAALTSKINKVKLPTHVFIEEGKGGLTKESIVMMEQIRTIDKTRLREKIGQLNYADMLKINMSIVVSFGLSLFTGILEVKDDKMYTSNNIAPSPSMV